MDYIYSTNDVKNFALTLRQVYNLISEFGTVQTSLMYAREMNVLAQKYASISAGYVKRYLSGNTLNLTYALEAQTRVDEVDYENRLRAILKELGIETTQNISTIVFS